MPRSGVDRTRKSLHEQPESRDADFEPASRRRGARPQPFDNRSLKIGIVPGVEPQARTEPQSCVSRGRAVGLHRARVERIPAALRRRTASSRSAIGAQRDS